MSLPDRIKAICARSRRARYEINVIALGPRKAKKLYDAMEKLIATPIRKRKSSKKTERRFEGIEPSADLLKRIEAGYQPDRLRNKHKDKG